MVHSIFRRDFLKVGAGSCALCLSARHLFAAGSASAGNVLISPGCRKSKVKVAKLYLGKHQAHWPTPLMDLNAEVARYESEFEKMGKEISDVDFSVSQLVSTKDDLAPLKETLKEADGILLIHLSMGVRDLINEVLALTRPTILFAAPYSGHEWTGFGALAKESNGQLDVILSSDMNELAVALRPFRALHHLREAKILNVTGRPMNADYLQAVKDRFGTEILAIDRDRTLAAFESVSESDALDEAQRWIDGAAAVVEPSRDEILRSCRLALAFEKLLDEEEATAITVDCYGSMYRQLPAFPCIGFTRLNDMGFAGICESDLRSALTFMILQGLSGRPGFISDPTMDGEKIILAHCMGTRRMDGPDGPEAPYKLRSIMERQEGAVPQIAMRTGQKATQAILAEPDLMLSFTGDIVEAPDLDRGCRTKITLEVDGSAEHLWQNWSHGLHRVTCYGDVTRDLRRFCGFKGIRMVDEAAA